MRTHRHTQTHTDTHRHTHTHTDQKASQVVPVLKNAPANAGAKRLEEGMATHFSILACGIPWTEEPGRLQSTGVQKVR